MEQTLIKKLWKSSHAIEHFLFQPDEHGLAEFKPKVAVVTLIVVLVIYMAVSAWAG